MRLILDVGSGASVPDDKTALRFIDEVAKRDSKKHEIVFKFQLFKDAPPNTPLDRSVFQVAYRYASDMGYKVTSSVFDMGSLAFLLMFDIPFVKIACRPDLYWLAGEVPRKVPVYASYDIRGNDKDVGFNNGVDVWMVCVPQYPAHSIDYMFCGDFEPRCISDHTVGWSLFHSLGHPDVWEKHLKLPDTTGPDAGPWAVTPDELAEVIS